LTTSFEVNYQSKLESLAQKHVISEEQLSHFLNRGVQVISPKHNFGLESLQKYLPEIVIGASQKYIEKMTVPYQATSFIAANTNRDRKGPYIFKIPGQHSGGISLLTGGSRKPGDNIFASIHRILIGYKAVMVSGANLIVNKDKVWDWQFFGNYFKSYDPDVYEDLSRLIKKTGISKAPAYYVVVCRSDATFKRLKIVDEYMNNRIAVLNPINNIKVIFLTNRLGYEYASKSIIESDLVNYVITGNDFNISEAMLRLRKDYNIDIMLNDGGRQMSNGIRNAGLIGEERITLEPYPGYDILPEEIDPTSILGVEGIGLDQSEIEGGILLHSTKIDDEFANVYVYPLDDKRVMSNLFK
jgi:hypothetical protein